MVNVARTRLVFFTLAGLPDLFTLASKGSGTWVTFLTGGDFFAAGRVLAAGRTAVGFAAVFAALAAAGTRVLASLVDAVAATRDALGRGGGLATSAPGVLGAVAADSVLPDFLVSSAMVYPRFFDMCSIWRSFHLWVPWLRWRVDQFHISNGPKEWPYAKNPYSSPCNTQSASSRILGSAWHASL